MTRRPCENGREVKRVLVTGANSGIGLALCKRLVTEYGCYVYLGARDPVRGEAAVTQVKDTMHSQAANDAIMGGVEFVLIDVSDEESVVAAASFVERSLPVGESLYALVNNAGAGFAHKVSPSVIIDTNLFGPKRVVDAFLPLLKLNEQRGPRDNTSTGGGSCSTVLPRIVNVGSGAGPEFVAMQPSGVRKRMTDPMSVTWEDIVALSQYNGDCVVEAYGLSKALLASYTLLLARELRGVVCSCLNPGFIQSGMTAGYGATLTPDQGTISALHCLFATLTAEDSGAFYDSNGVVAPLDEGRDTRTYEASPSDGQ